MSVFKTRTIENREVTITIRVSETEHRAFKNALRTHKTNLNLNITATEFLRHCIKRCGNLEFLQNSGIITNYTMMQIQNSLFPTKNKTYPRIENLKGLKK